LRDRSGRPSGPSPSTTVCAQEVRRPRAPVADRKLCCYVVCACHPVHPGGPAAVPWVRPGRWRRRRPFARPISGEPPRSRE
jgi:hypothetical protein